MKIKKNIKILINARPENVCVIYNFLFDTNKYFYKWSDTTKYLNQDLNICYVFFRVCFMSF